MSDWGSCRVDRLLSAYGFEGQRSPKVVGLVSWGSGLRSVGCAAVGLVGL